MKTKALIRLSVVAMLISILPFSTISAQFSLSGELRPRAEYRHGFKELVTDDDLAAFFVSQRTRLNANYKHSNMQFGLGIQEVRVWGNTPQLANASNQLMIHQAWGAYYFTDKLSLKFGRQELVYDDARIFGNVDWAQQARAHDLVLFRYEGSYKLHIGAAFNQDAENLSGTDYLTAGYKAMQFVWYNRMVNRFNLSALFLNNGVQHNYVEGGTKNYKTVYSQTVGGRLNMPSKPFSAYAEGYYTTGKGGNNKNMDAFLFKFGGRFNLNDNIGLLAGYEYLSGTSQDANPADDDFVNKSFNPFYGTNHKFNGHMDYFYVGNHINSVGLGDLHGGLMYSRNAFGVNLTAHFFSATAAVLDGHRNAMDNKLGTEIDLSFSYKLADQMTISGGYSQMFGTKTLQQLKGGDHKATNNWAWLMVTFRPVFI
jgi:hypothetical protein